jgi:hypothetical protein
MSISALDWAFKTSIQNPGAKFVLVSLANYADEEDKCFPSKAHISKMTGIAERTIQEHLTFLEEGHYIKKTFRFLENGKQTSSVYEVNMPTKQNLPGQGEQNLPGTTNRPTGGDVSSPNTLEDPEEKTSPISDEIEEGASPALPVIPEKPKKEAHEVWTDFKALLVLQGNEQKNAGAMVGKLIQKFGAERVGRIYEANRELIYAQTESYGYFMEILKRDKTLNRDEAEIQKALSDAKHKHYQKYLGLEEIPVFEAGPYVKDWPILQKYLDQIAVGERKIPYGEQAAIERQTKFKDQIIEQAKFYGRI